MARTGLNEHAGEKSTVRAIARAARRTEIRARVDAALQAFVSQSVLALGVSGAALALAKVSPALPGVVTRSLLLGSLLSVLLAAAFAAGQRLPSLWGAMLLDRCHDLSGRLSNALAFSRLPAPTAMMEAAIADACLHAKGLSPRRAHPIAVPRDLPMAIIMTMLVTLVGLVELRHARIVPATKALEPALLNADDVDLFREVGKQIGEQTRDPELLALLSEYNRLVEDLAHRKLDRPEAFRRLERLQSRIVTGAGLDAKSTEEELKIRASALEKSELTRPAAEALRAPDLPKAEQALRDLAKRLREKPDSARKAELDRLREALRKAAQGQKERTEALEQQRNQLRERQEQLLKKKESADAGVETDEEKRLLSRQNRELERLDRELSDQEKSRRKLERLDRELAQAAEDLMRDLGASADDIDKAAEDIHRMADESMSDKQREELLKRIEDLREQIRQGGQLRSQRLVQIRRFARMARDGTQAGNKDRGQGSGQEQEREDGEQSQGQSSQNGSGNGNGSQGEMLTIGPGGRQMVLLPSARTRDSPGQGTGSQGSQPGPEGSERGDRGSDGHEQGGRDWGTGHDPNLLGPSATDPKMGTEDVQASGLDTGQGVARSEVIQGAGERGFRGGAYKRVYGEYRTSAEEHIKKDRVPPGANERIRRYFDLIRPRE